MPKKYRSDALAAIHETMEALHDVGAINKQTRRNLSDARAYTHPCLISFHHLTCPKTHDVHHLFNLRTRDKWNIGIVVAKRHRERIQFTQLIR